jgi:DNA-binding NarL/FixJ family response regulator
MRVMIAEDSGLLRQLLVDTFESEAMIVTGACDTADHLLKLVDTEPPDVVILDIRLPPTHTDEGIRAAEFICKNYAGIGVLILSHYAETFAAMRLLAARTHGIGYLVKDRVADPEFLIDAVETVANSGVVIDAEVVARISERRRHDNLLVRLSPSERHVLEHMAQGLSNLAIAKQLGYSVKTVEKRVTSLVHKLGIAMNADDRNDVNVRVATVLTYLRYSDTGGVSP